MKYTLCCFILALVMCQSAVAVSYKKPVPIPERTVDLNLPGLEIDFEEVKVSQFPFMELFFSITDPKGRSAASLERKNFRLYESNLFVRKFEITMDKTPLSIVLLLDRSGSMYPSLLHMKMAARKFISLLEAGDEVMLIDFSDEPKILCDFTTDKSKLNACLATLKAYGPTALYDSLYRAVLELADHKRGRQVIVALTDGTDQNEKRTAHLSRHTLKEVVERAIVEKIPINAIGLGRSVSKKELRYLSKKTNGTFYYAPTSYQLQDLYTVIGKNLKNRVRLLYKSPVVQWNGEWRDVQLKCRIGGAPVGESTVKYRAPGKYVLEMAGQGWSRFKLEEFAKEEPSFKVRDLYLKTLVHGKPDKMLEWMKSYYLRK